MASIFTATLDTALVALFAILTLVPRVYCNLSDQGIITRDVCIIGGGSSGTYAAVRLHDSGKSVIVIERDVTLGGHTNTYVDPATNQTVDYGVIVFEDRPIVRNYLDRFGVAFQKTWLSGRPDLDSYADFANGNPVNTFTPPGASGALGAYLDRALKYPDLETGFYLPNPIPEDLLLPFGDFVQKYNLGDAVHIIAAFTQGLGDLLRQPTLYVLKNFSPGVVGSIPSGFLNTVNINTHEIYDKALELLRSNVILNSTVMHTNRSSSNYVEIAVRTPSGPRLIRANKLLITIPPLLRNLNGFDLGSDERDLFSKFLHTGYYTGLIRNTGLNSSVINVSPDRPYYLARLNGLYQFQETNVPGLIDVKYGSLVELPDEHVKTDIISAIKRLQSRGIAASSTGEPEFAAFRSHAPFELTVSTQDINAGFYQRLYALQGHRNTFYTGAAFHAHNSALLWGFTEKLLPRLMD